MEEQPKEEIKKNKYLSFLKNNWILILILIIAFIIRVIYFNVNSAMWWDEAEYMNIAKHWVFKIPMDLNPQRPPLFPLIISFFYLLKSSEAIIRFFVVLIPSFLIVFFTYKVGKVIYNKRIALIATFIMAVFWLLIFNTARVHTDALSILFNLIAIYLFWKYYIKTYNKKYIWLIGLFLGLGFLTRIVAVLIAIIIIVYLIITERTKFLKDKNIWISFIGLLIVLIPYLIWSKITFDKFLAFTHGYTEKNVYPIAWYIFKFFQVYNEWFLFIFFIIGLLTLYKLIIGFDLVIKDKEGKLKNDLFILLWIIIPLIYFVFFQRAAEDRWLMPIAPAVFLLVGKGITIITDFIKKYSKALAIIAILCILLFGAVQQLTHADDIIKIKKDSEYQIKPAGLWLKDNSNRDDTIMSNNVYMELQYFSDRKILSVAGSEDEMKTKLKENNAKYYVVTSFYKSEDWTYEYPSKHQESLKPVQVYYLNEAKTQPVLVIYEIKDYENL